MEENQFVNKFVDIIFSKNNVKYLILLFLIGFILRSIAAVNISPNADEMVHGTHALGIINSNKLQIMDEDAVWFYITDLFYNIFGQNLFGLRFASIIFGALSIILVYLIGKELFNKRTALISAFILTLSSYHFLMTLADMDTSMILFVLVCLYFLIKALKENKNLSYYLSALFLGIAIMIKQIAVLFIPAFFIFVLYYKYKNKEFNLKFKKLFYVLIIIFITIIPILTFNYLLYKDKSLVDLQFSRFLGVGKETYSSIEATLKPFRFSDLFFKYENHPPGLYEAFTILYNYAPLILILGLIGIIFSYKRNKEFTLLILLSFLIPFIFLAGTSLLAIHFVFSIPLLCLFSANFLDFIIVKAERFRLKTKTVLYVILLILLVFTIFEVKDQGAFKGKNEITKIVDFKKDNIKEDSLVVVDSRVYRGRIVLAFNDRHYLEASLLNDLIQNQDKLPEDYSSINTYFIECVTDDCGWGTINSQPEFNKSMEDIVNFFKNSSTYLTTIKNSYGDDYFNIYNTNLRLKQSSLQLADSTHSWFYYPVRYKGESFDDYETKNFFDKFLDKIAHYILYLEILISLITPFYIFYLLFKEENEAEHNNSGI